MVKDRFIDKKKALRFKVVPNPDPTSSNPNQFVPKFPNNPHSQRPDIYRIFDDDYHYVPEDGSDQEEITIDDEGSTYLLDHIVPATNPNVGEAAKYGIFYDDRHYDYLQHMLPSSRTTQPALEDPDQESSQLNLLTYQGLKEIVSDPEIAEVLTALDDDAFQVQDLGDDFFLKIDIGDAKSKQQRQQSTDIEEQEFIDIETYSDEQSIDLNEDQNFSKYCNDLSLRCEYADLRAALRQPEFKYPNYQEDDEDEEEEEEGDDVEMGFVVPPKKQPEQVKVVGGPKASKSRRGLKIISEKK